MTKSTSINTSQRLTADVLKKMITSFLLSRDSDGVLGYEVMYGSSRRVADMVFISKGHSYAIEIKSEFDTTARLQNQLHEYLSLFDYILVFSAPKHINTINAILPENVGLYSIMETGVQKKRHEKINHHVKKSELLISIPSAAVKTNFSVKGKLTSDEIRAVVMKKSYKTIHNFFINYFKERLINSSTKRTDNHKQLEQPNDYIII